MFMRNMRSNNNRGGFGGKSRGNRFGGRSGGFGDRSHFRKGHDGARSERRIQMHDAVCNNCGKSCQVPFRPTGSKPVLCQDCFQQNSGSKNNFTGNVQGGSGEQLNQINTKLDRILRVLQDLEIDVEEDAATDSDNEIENEDEVFDDEEDDDSDDDEDEEEDTK
ncbi:MAG: hypothetical protein RL557_232 [archaeon]|jgi:CxxC-x17-CxxC domain-containing protein